MAIVHFVKCQKSQTVGGLHGVLSYCCKEEKVACKGGSLISGVNCVPQAALQEFLNTKRQYKNMEGRMYYHMVQSFHPGDPITPEQAHEIALKLAEQIPGFEIVVATHTDREHIHSHFIINSVSFETGKKYHSNLDSLNALRHASDELCRQYGLPTLKPEKKKKEHTMSGREYRAYEKGQSWKLDLELTIDECMTKARSREHFIRLMEYSGCEVKWTADRKYITYTTPAGYKCRDSKLNGRKYHKEEMEYEFGIRQEICRGNAGSPEGTDFAGGSSHSRRGGFGKELGSHDRVPENADQDLGTAAGNAGYADDSAGIRNQNDELYSDFERGWEGKSGSHAGIPEGADLGGAEHDSVHAESDEGHGETGWEYERSVFLRNLAGAGTDEAYFSEARMDLDSPQPDSGSLGIGAAYLAADLSNILDHRPVEDSTTKRFQPERKNRHGHTMGGM